MRTSSITSALFLATMLAGCAARSAEMYRDDTRALLATKSSAIHDCYNAALISDADAAAKIVVRFTVQADTGTIVDAKVDDAQSTGDKALGECVVDAISGLTLDPPDERDGDATFTWEFQIKG